MIDLIASALIDSAIPKQSELDRCDVPQMSQILREAVARHEGSFIKIESCVARSLVAIARFRSIEGGTTTTQWATFYGSQQSGEVYWRWDSYGTSLNSQILNTPTFAGEYFNRPSVYNRLAR